MHVVIATLTIHYEANDQQKVNHSLTITQNKRFMVVHPLLELDPQIYGFFSLLFILLQNIVLCTLHL
jgi:hypothetical protein